VKEPAARSWRVVGEHRCPPCRRRTSLKVENAVTAARVYMKIDPAAPLLEFEPVDSSNPVTMSVGSRKGLGSLGTYLLRNAVLELDISPRASGAPANSASGLTSTQHRSRPLSARSWRRELPRPTERPSRQTRRLGRTDIRKPPGRSRPPGRIQAMCQPQTAAKKMAAQGEQP
jgi:hypothetical protein